MRIWAGEERKSKLWLRATTFALDIVDGRGLKQSSLGGDHLDKSTLCTLSCRRTQAIKCTPFAGDHPARAPIIVSVCPRRKMIFEPLPERVETQHQATFVGFTRFFGFSSCFCFLLALAATSAKASSEGSEPRFFGSLESPYFASKSSKKFVARLFCRC